MKPFTRRGALFGGSLLLGAGLTPNIAQAQAAISAPSGPMRLSRMITRTLRGGAMLRVDRSWQIAFRPQGTGFSIMGEQLDAKVQAPPSLASLAAIEEARSTADMWPIMLSEQGEIVAAGSGIREEDLAAAIREAEAMIAEREVPASIREAQAQYLAQIQRTVNSLLESLPSDLFFPKMGPMRTVQTLELAEGVTGEFEIIYDAVPAQEGAWLGKAERQVITRLGDSRQRAIEEWTLTDM